MEREYEEDKVIISRKKLEELEQAKVHLEEQIKEERRKFKESAKYCIKGEIKYFHGIPIVSEDVYSNSDVLNKILDRSEKQSKYIQSLLKDIEKYKSFWILPLYKRVFKSFKNKL